MLNEANTVTVTNCTFNGNSATGVCGVSGGMFNFEGAVGTVTNCTFSGNSASSSSYEFNGGAMSNHYSDLQVTNCTFSENRAPYGGGMHNHASHPAVINCTFTGNSAVHDGGAMYSIFPAVTSYVTNCVLWGNSPNDIVHLGTLVDVTYSNIQGGWPGTGNIDAGPLFVDPDNGDLRLSPGSPCIDAGDNTAVPEDITTDLEGNPRFVDDPYTVDTGYGDPPMVDMGAYEFQPCPWDLSGDGTVNVVDLLMLLAEFGSCDGSPADFNGDGWVTVVDLLALIANFGPCPGSLCVWDVTGDGVVDQSDLQRVLDNMGLCDECPEDVNGDGIVNGQDAAAVATHFGPCP
jgi:predicted outer membrane repeat protein